MESRRMWSRLNNHRSKKQLFIAFDRSRNNFDASYAGKTIIHGIVNNPQNEKDVANYCDAL